MEKSSIMDILSDWNFWEKNIDAGIERKKYVENIEKFLRTGQIITLQGIRRSGKSTIMKQYIAELIRGGILPKNTLFINFEDPRFPPDISVELIQIIYDTYLENMSPQGKPYIFLDEVQNVNRWEKFARAINERGLAHIIVSGSSSKLLSEEFGTALTGRRINIDVFPLDFREFLRFKNVVISGKLDIISKRHELRRLFGEFLEFGAFPKIVLSLHPDEKKAILRDYYEDILSKDIVVRHRIKAVEKLKALSKYYLTNIASPVSFNSIKKFLGIPLFTVERFSNYLNSAYLFFYLKRHSFSLKEQEVNPRKVYCIDTGLRNAISFRFSEDAGKIAENLVFLELFRRKEDIYYWKDDRQHEVDFILRDDLKVRELIQVAWRIEDAKTKEREIRALFKALDEFDLNEGLIITEDFEGEERIKDKMIIYKPLWKWLLLEK